VSRTGQSAARAGGPYREPREALTHRLLCPPEAAGQRIDSFLAAALEVARNQIQGWIDDGRVLLDGRPVRASTRLAGGEQVSWHAPPPLERRVVPEEGALTVLFEDDHLVALDKPPGLVVHPGAGRATGTLVHRLLARYPEMAGVGGEGRPGIVHRLDKDTSGVLVAARTPSAYGRLSRAFAERRVDKRYLAVVYGVPEPRERLIDAPIGRHPSRRREMTVRTNGRPARSFCRVRATAAGVSLLEVELLTGRTHQVRVHLRSIGHPLVGDPVYGEARWRRLADPERRVLATFSRPALHAWRLVLPHPENGEPLEVAAPPAADLDGLWDAVAGRTVAAVLDGTGRPGGLS
jgi:23S rRNA pseudouridine1911/1915/1917 synthase